MEIRTFKCRIGWITVSVNQGAIVAISYSKQESRPSSDTPSALLDRAEEQLLAYLDGKLQTFDLPIRLVGTPFQVSVWKALLAIPYGSTSSYGDIATRIGCPKAARAVGMACNRNPLMIVVPCHRVVGTKGRLTGFACGLDIKRQLLEIERI